MPFYDLQKELVKRKEILASIINNKTAALKSAPPGNLRILKRKNHYQYYLRNDPKDTNGVYIPKKEIQKAAEIMQRDYDRKIIENASEELSKIDQYLEFLTEKSIEGVIDYFNESRKRLIAPVSLTDEEYVNKWNSKSYEPMGFSDDYDEFYSINGTRVRSKSEVIIANMLEQYSIPYKYECPLILSGNHLVRPDFTCLNIKKRQEIIWEHLGMMDDPDYAEKNIRKLSLYEKNGYIVGRNMIVTFESSHVPPASNIIKSTIENFLL